MMLQEWIPRADGSRVDRDPKFGRCSLDVAVKHHREVLLDPVHEVQEILVAEGRCDHPVELLPQHNRPRTERCQLLIYPSGSRVRGTLKKHPAIAPLSGED